MSDTQEKSDDLIAELAKLMASNAQGTDGAPKPTVIKLPPLNEATIQAAPVRIPGMDAPRPAQAAAAAPQAAAVAAPASPPPSGAAPPIRIPGMVRPAGVDPAPVPPARVAAPNDMNKPQAARPVVSSPVSNWERGEPSAESAAAHRAETSGAAPRPSTPQPVAAAPPKADSDDHLGFDFGFGGEAPKGHEESAEPQDDPIADLITAELDAADEVKAAEAPVPVAAQPVRIEHVEPQPVVAKPVAQPRPTAVAPIQIKPVTVAPRAPETDRFAVAPVFGFNAKAAAAVAPPQVEHAAPAAHTPAPAKQPALESRRGGDPLDEIESLIGSALNVSDEPRQQAPKTAPPAVPPLNSGFTPRRAGLKDNDPQVQSAEAAIRAAASTDEVRIDSPSGEDRPYKRMKVKPPRTSFIAPGARPYVGIALAGTLLLASGFGLFWVLGLNRGPETPPTLTADATPAKVEPTAVAAADPVRSVVFDEIDGVADAGEETLVSRDETAGVDVAEVARVVTPPAESEETAGGLANRKVRTVTVRPDGTIVSGDDAVAGAEALPVVRPNVPEIAGAATEPSDLLTAIAEAGDGATADGTAPDPIAALVSDTGAATTTPLADPAPLQVAAVTTGSVAPVFDASIVPPVPMPRPFDRSALATGSRPLATVEEGAANAPASTPLVAVSQPAAAPLSSGSGAYVQLSSQRSESEAAQALRATQSRMAGSLNGTPLEIRRVDLGAKGVWYRVVLPVASFQDATQACAAIKSNGGDCVAING